MSTRRTNRTVPPIEHAKRLFEEAGGTLRAGQARGAGVHPRTLAAMVEAGTLRRVSRGLYQLADGGSANDPDLAVVALKAPSAVVCLISALALHELTTQIPHRVDLALPPGSRAPKLAHPPIRVYRFGGRSMTEGIERHDLNGTTVRVFSPPKTVADCFRFRNKIGLDVAIEAVRDCLRQRRATPAEILRFAEIDRVSNVMRPYIEAVI